MKDILTPEKLLEIFPLAKSDAFFDALYGEAEDGAYDIVLCLGEYDNCLVELNFELRRRKSKCLACSLTYGLPSVFERHPVIDLKNTLLEVARAINWDLDKVMWKIGKTKEVNSNLHIVPIELLCV